MAWQRIALRAWTQQPKVRILALPVCDPVIVYLVFNGSSDSVVLMGKGWDKRYMLIINLNSALN